MDREQQRQWIIGWSVAAVFLVLILGIAWWQFSTPIENRSPLGPLIIFMAVLNTVSYMLQRKQPQSRQTKFRRVLGAFQIVILGLLAMALLWHLLEPR